MAEYDQVLVEAQLEPAQSQLVLFSKLKLAVIMRTLFIKYCHSHDQRASLESTLQNENSHDKNG